MWLSITIETPPRGPVTVAVVCVATQTQGSGTHTEESETTHNHTPRTLLNITGLKIKSEADSNTCIHVTALRSCFLTAVQDDFNFEYARSLGDELPK